MIIFTIRDKSALAVTRDYPDTILGYYPNYPDSPDISTDRISRIVSEDSIGKLVSVVNTV
jgi:hypothetical protein